MSENLHCQFCHHEASAHRRGANLFVTHSQDDHAAELDLKAVVKDLLTTPNGVDLIREAIVETPNGSCLVR